MKQVFRIRPVICLLLLGLLLSGCGKTATVSSSGLRSTKLEKYRMPVDTLTLQPGDKIQILLHKPDLETFMEVIDDHGCVTLPYLGPVLVGGLTTAKAEEVIKLEYVRRKIYRDGAIQIAIVPPMKEFYVQGQVNHPGPYQYTRAISVQHAISMAGGRNAYADSRMVKLIRGTSVYMIDIKKDSDRPIEPGDIIEVPRGIL